MQRFGQRLITIAGDVFADILWIQLTAVLQSDALLLGIKTNLIDIKDFFLSKFINIIHFQTFYRLTPDKMLLDDLRDIFRFDMTIENFIRINRHNRAFLTKAETAGFNHADLLIQSA